MTNTKNSFKLPEKNKNMEKRENLQNEIKSTRSKLAELKQSLNDLNGAEKVIDSDISKNKTIAQAIGDSNSDLKKLEKSKDVLNKKRDKIIKEIERLNNEEGTLNKVARELKSLEMVDDLTYFVELQQVLWNVNQDIIKNGTNHDELLNEIKEIFFSEKGYKKKLVLLTSPNRFDNLIEQIKEVSG
jgi:chromosome segregation ATPase